MFNWLRNLFHKPMPQPIILDTIEGQPVYWDGEVMTFKGYGRIDNDGSGPAQGDPYHQNDTSLHYQGKPLNAATDRFCVIPGHLVSKVGPIVLGCQGYVTYKGHRKPCVVGDKGPRRRIGEISTALAEAFGIDPDPNTGGVDEPVLYYEIYPGVPAVVEGKQYQLQRS
jgi:hypothetical protein